MSKYGNNDLEIRGYLGRLFNDFLTDPESYVIVNKFI